MLIDVAAFASVALGPVAEAFVAQEIGQYSIVQSWTATGRDILPAEKADVADLPMAQPGPMIAPLPATRPSERATGVGRLQQLALLSGPNISRYIAAHPDAVGAILASPPPPRDVTIWWSTLDSRARITLKNATPELIGNLEGVPVQVRDSANRTMLHLSIDKLDRLVGSDAGRSMVENAKQQLNMLQSISGALDEAATSNATRSATPETAGEAQRTLLSLDVAGQGRAAIVLGDLETADYVTYLVPGMFFTIENQMGAWVDAAGQLYDQQLDWLDYFGGQPGASTKPSTVATVAWIGYHTPNLTNVGGIQNANEGRDALASAIMGLQSMRSADEPYVTVVAHSYGSTAALMALTEYDFSIDALALVGSPGSPAKSVDELNVRGGNVFVGEAAWDPIPNSSYFGSDPGSASYGAKTMGVGGGVDSITGASLAASIGHNEYFSPGTQSMRNFALIAIGKGQYVTDGRPLVMAKSFGAGR